jgi:hypothetical protein
MGRHTIWQQGLAINECRLAIVQPDPKYKSQLLAKTCRDVAQQGENKERWKERTEQANNTDFFFFLNFSLIFPKGASRNQTFLFFHNFFYNFLWTRIKKDATIKIGTYHWGGMWSTQIQHVLWKVCKNFDNFFLYFRKFFWQFWWNQTGRSQLLLSVDNTCKMILCW